MNNENLFKQMSPYPAFYQKVWRECMKIPKGETRSYGWIADRVGRPQSARAVGQALAKNPFAPNVPCHRVIRADGSLGGYSANGGLKKKKTMLEDEKLEKFEKNTANVIIEKSFPKVSSLREQRVRFSTGERSSRQVTKVFDSKKAARSKETKDGDNVSER